MELLSLDTIIDGIKNTNPIFYLLLVIVSFITVVLRNSITHLVVVPFLVVILSMTTNLGKLIEAEKKWAEENDTNAFVSSHYPTCRKPGIFQNGSRAECTNTILEYSESIEVDIVQSELIGAIEAWESNFVVTF